MLTIFLHEKNLQARLFSADFMQIEFMILCVYEQHVIDAFLWCYKHFQCYNRILAPPWFTNLLH